MAIDMATALSEYGFVGTLANSIPELRAILNQAAAEEWDPNRFQRAVEDSGWWKSNADSVRQLAVLQATDPGTYNQNLGNAANKVYLLSQQMGRPTDPATTQRLALQALTYNWDEQQLRAQIGTQFGLEHWSNLGSPALTGEAGQLSAQLRQTAANYGVAVTDQWVENALFHIQSGGDTLEGFQNILRARAKASYPQFADQIDSGMTVRDIADPWIATMANTLELSSSQVKLTDPLIQRALTQRGQDGVASSMPLWQFERMLKDDPRWDQTKQARQQVDSTLLQVGRDFGFVGGS